MHVCVKKIVKIVYGYEPSLKKFTRGTKNIWGGDEFCPLNETLGIHCNKYEYFVFVSASLLFTYMCTQHGLDVLNELPILHRDINVLWLLNYCCGLFVNR